MNSEYAVHIFMTANLAALCYVAVGFIYFFCRRSQSRNVRAFSYVYIAESIWVLGQLLSAVIMIYIPDETAFFWANKLTYLGMCLMPPTVLFFSWVYCGKYKLYTNRRILYLLSIISALFFVVIVTDPFHHLYYINFSISERTYAPVWYIFTLWSYVCIIVSGTYVISYHRHYRRKAIKIFILCYSMPFISNTLSIFIRDNRFDFTAISLCFMLTGAYILIFRQKMIVISPIAAKKILTELPYPVLILSKDENVIFENIAARESNAFTEFLTHTNSGVMRSDEKVYRTKITNMPDDNKMVMFLDITEYSKLLEELKAQSEELLSVRDMLMQQMEEAEQNAINAESYAAQRSRREISAKLSSKVYVVINQILDNTQKALQDKTPEKEAIQKNIDLTVAGIEMVRAIINEFRKGDNNGL